MPTTPPTVNVIALQQAADALAPGAFVISVVNRTLPVEQFDAKGRNRAATWAVCPTCNGAREIKAADGLWDDCATCNREGSVMTAVQTVSIPVIQMFDKARTTHEMPTMYGTGRADQWQARTAAEMMAFVQATAQTKKG